MATVAFDLVNIAMALSFQLVLNSSNGYGKEAESSHAADTGQ